MKLKIAVMVFAVGILGVASLFCLYVPVGASQSTTQVAPVVTVDSTAVLDIVSGTKPENNNAIEFGTVPAGTSITKPLVLSVSANSGWTLQVSKSQDLKDGNIHAAFPSSSLTFTASGPEGPTYTASATEFGYGTPATVVACQDQPINGAHITVSYALIVPGDQPVGNYSAHHTYTLVMP